MRRFSSLALLVAVAALVAAILAPATVAQSAGVKIRLTGPSSATQGTMIKLKAAISNPERADGSDRIILLKNVNGHLKRQASCAPMWTNGGRKGVAYFWVMPTPSAMGIAKYRAAWMHPEGTTRSNVLRVEID
jgi:hypothetical protein